MRIKIFLFFFLTFSFFVSSLLMAQPIGPVGPSSGSSSKTISSDDKGKVDLPYKPTQKSRHQSSGSSMKPKKEWPDLPFFPSISPDTFGAPDLENTESKPIS